MHSFWNKFIDIVKKYPDNTAILDKNHPVSYQELCNKASALGEHLKAKGIKQEKRVGIAMNKSADYITALLATWYAGGAFIPLPLCLPKERYDFIINDAKPDIVLSSIEALPITNINPVQIQPETLAYIIYTSGSTGTPKGVMVEHRGIVNFIEAQIKSFQLTTNSKYLFHLSISFDASISDIGVALLSGACLIIEEDGVIKDAKAFLTKMHEHEITHIDMPPSLLRVFDPTQMPDSLETIIIGGEASQPEIIRKWAEKFRLINVYGPTETTVCTSLNQCDPIKWDKPIIGDPLPNVSYHIIDNELYIGGCQLARGYLNLPELTAEKFITYSNERLYKTGDKVRRRDNGEIEFLGRIDRQFKLRGQLIEPDEIEATLIKHPNILKAHVMKRTSNSGDMLVAFITTKTKPYINELTEFLNSQLSDWMIPQHLEILNHMPETSTGKINTAALKLLPLNLKTNSEYIPAKTPMERKLLTLWQSVLKHDGFGITSPFFSVGGDSLNIMKLTLLAETQNINLSPAIIVKYPSIRGQARYLESQKTSENGTLSTEFLKQDVMFDTDFKERFAQIETSNVTLPYQNILLTGATGFLGSRLLTELLKKTNGLIHCLVRANDHDQALGRIKNAVYKHPVSISDQDWERIIPLPGDLSKSYFGWNKASWSNLSQRIDAIYHCAAWVNMVQDYQTMRPANIGGTLEILKFATEGAFKHLHYASTLSVFVATDQNTGRALESDDLSKTKTVYGGYAQTKWAAEYMLRQVPKDACKITHYRFGLITGDSETGYSTDGEFLNTFIQGIASLGIAPEVKDDTIAIDITPIDYAAQAMSYLSLNRKYDTYHIANPHSLSLKKLLHIMHKDGIIFKTLPAQEWNEECKKRKLSVTESSTYMALCRCLPKEDFERYRVMDLFQATNITFDTTNTDKSLKDIKLTCPQANERLISTYLNYNSKETEKREVS